MIQALREKKEAEKRKLIDRLIDFWEKEAENWRLMPQRFEACIVYNRTLKRPQFTGLYKQSQSLIKNFPMPEIVSFTEKQKLKDHLESLSLWDLDEMQKSILKNKDNYAYVTISSRIVDFKTFLREKYAQVLAFTGVELSITPADKPLGLGAMGNRICHLFPERGRNRMNVF